VNGVASTLREPALAGSTPKHTHSRRALLGVSATTFLLLGIWLGPDRAVFLIAVAAVVSGWFLACRRWPLVAIFTTGFIRGLLRR
jgi:hypothetical protein